MPIRMQDAVPISEACLRLAELVEDVVAGAEKVLAKDDSTCVAIADARKPDYYHALEAEHSRLILLQDVEHGLRNALANKVQSGEDFRNKRRLK